MKFLYLGKWCVYSSYWIVYCYQCNADTCIYMVIAAGCGMTVCTWPCGKVLGLLIVNGISCSINILCDLLYENGPLIFWIFNQYWTWVDSSFCVEYNGESFQSILCWSQAMIYKYSFGKHPLKNDWKCIEKYMSQQLIMSHTTTYYCNITELHKHSIPIIIYTSLVVIGNWPKWSCFSCSHSILKVVTLALTRR